MNKDLLIEELILQDLRHMQLIYGLEAIGFNEESFHSLELSYCIADLMGFKGEDLIDGFFTVYWDNLEKCKDFEMTYSRENLRPLAKGCYLELKKLKGY
ncbi:hypothetical protein SAMN04489724_2597 [Algoriphagus locisalis]|uniref:Uncharacterized protein n=1 Tax=Algoriphagus locisalis TaxID=305507 RepID=A0A1I7BPR1_9BACT|nr:hypothetical protein [Algoriphagus locisalis]SFT89156.1 hypothetical protein SAMN04489724_2597 [Algoriphagus locisalis]